MGFVVVVTCGLGAGNAASAQARPIDRNERQAIIEGVAAELTKGYVFRDVPRAMIQDSRSVDVEAQ